MFYNMFLDEDVRSSLSEYDALSIVEWDVLVASDNSFEELYHAAFRVNEEFWVKGSNLEGTLFHSNADAIEMWQVLGHINGNAIYNNDDPAFVEYVEYTRARWGYEHPYDVALWMTLSDLPLYQRYSSKFVVTNLISSVGYGHVNHDTVSDAVAGKTLFVHGSSVDEGNVAPYEATEGDVSVDVAATQRHLTEDVPKWKAQEKWRNNTVPKWKRNQKWKTKNDDGVPKWRANQKWKKQYEDSPDEEGCMDGCEYTSMDGTRGRVCDSNCSRRDAYGTLGCGAKGGKYGADCRACFNDVGKARKQDTPGNRAIMCSTKMPADVYDRRLTADGESDPLLVARDLVALQEDASSPSEKEGHRRLAEDVPKWKAQDKWRNNTVPKWKRNQKWKKQYEDSPDEEGDGGTAPTPVDGGTDNDQGNGTEGETETTPSDVTIEGAFSEDIVRIIDVEGVVPGGASWSDSYSVGSKCYMQTTFDHDIGEVVVDTPQGPMKIGELFDLLEPGPGSQDRPLYNDIQCGNGPTNSHQILDEILCPGLVEYGIEGCGQIGPMWDLSELE
ncbi:unnamed protein product [Ectocarpus sp. 12 AP-2014]